jgi:hypothetical protein
MTALWRKLLGALWLATAAVFGWVVIAQVALMRAPEGSEEWRHSEWALPAAGISLLLAVMFAVSASALFLNWRWQRFWTYGPAIPFALLAGTAVLIARP